MLPQNPAPARLAVSMATVAGIAILCAGLQVAGWVEPLRYERHLIADGQLWRLLTGHFVHLGWRHWGMNIAGLALITGLFVDSMRPARMTACVAFSALIASAGLYAFSPAVGWYVGLSGALHGLFLAGLLAQWREAPVLSWGILAVLTGKLVYEHLYGALPGSEATAGGPVVVVAHSYGAIAGVLYWGMELGLREIRGKEQGKR